MVAHSVRWLLRHQLGRRVIGMAAVLGIATGLAIGIAQAPTASAQSPFNFYSYYPYYSYTNPYYEWGYSNPYQYYSSSYYFPQSSYYYPYEYSYNNMYTWPYSSYSYSTPTYNTGWNWISGYGWYWYP